LAVLRLRLSRKDNPTPCQNLSAALRALAEGFLAGESIFGSGSLGPLADPPALSPPVAEIKRRAAILDDQECLDAGCFS